MAAARFYRAQDPAYGSLRFFLSNMDFA